jgi:hypothetical protein
MLHADIVAIDQPLMFNRLGAQNINGMIFALKRDIVDDSEPARPLTMGGVMRRGHVFLRPDKRPRPLVLRVAEQDCLEIRLTNLLTTRSNPREPIVIPPTTLGAPPASVPAPPPKEIAGAFPSPRFDSEVDDQVADRMVGFHVQGMQLLQTIVDDATMVGRNPSGLIAPGGTITYRLYAEHEGAFLATSHGATFGGDATAGNSSNGLFASVNVEPLNARFYRSQLTEEELRLASSADADHIGGQGSAKTTGHDQPVIDYEARYPSKEPWLSEGKADLPILNMLSGDEIVHSDINAIIAGPDADGGWTSKCPKKDETPPALEAERKVYDEKYKECPYPLEKVGRTNPSLPDRLESFREFTVIFHDQMSKVNAFPHFYSHKVEDENGAEIVNPLAQTLKAVGDVFMVNYGSGGVGSEMIANRLGVGPMHDCLSCAAEEFFLTSHAVGDPAMIVDVPANFGLDQCRPISVKGDASKPLSDTTHLADCGPPHTPGNINTIVGDKAKSLRMIGPKATRALYPDDPSNVHHSYINDHVKFRNLHTGKEHHIFHLHNHQWLYSPNDDNSNYIDAQAIGPGSSYTYEINFGGSGNRNKSAGDAIFHCHLYPHFAQGMWELWRIHDVMESGTPLEVSGAVGSYHLIPFALQSGLPVLDPGDSTRRLRALPDGEITAGTPIPAVIPLPGKAIAPMPGKVYVVAKSGSKSPVSPQLAAKDKQIAGLGSVAAIDRNDLIDASALSDEEKAANAAKTPLGAVLNPPVKVNDREMFLKNPGFPFWIAGIEHSVGQRPPTPPLDMLPAAPGKDASAGGWDGGLPRHALDGIAAAKSVIADNSAPSIDNLTRYDLSKKLVLAKPIWFPEDGTDIEKVAMAFHAVRQHPSYAVDMKGNIINDPDKKINFITNGGGQPLPGAPFHNPCVDDTGRVLNKDVIGNFFDGHGGIETKGLSPFSSDNPRVYKGADIQFDAVFNKAGWHYPQERIIALWEDVRSIISKAKAPEPLVIRNNTFDCTEFLHTNLVPEIFELDDYQVRTSTDIIGQHIHLPKWDLTTADGSSNGWNYEDGTLSPGAVHERLYAINKYNDTANRPVIEDVENRPVYTSENLRKENKSSIGKKLELAKHPYFDETYPFKLVEGAKVRTQNWLGARTTIQRWFFDPVVNTEGVHRGLGIIFTHDHYGPSTHQQIGLYATVLVEPAGSEWNHNETGEKMGVRADGGPTSWQAVVRTGADQRYLVTDNDPTLKVKSASRDLDGDGEDDSYREFYLEYSDFQHAYLPGKYVGADPNGAIANKDEVDLLPEKIKDPILGPYLPDETSYKFAINPPLKDDVARTNPINLVEYAAACKIFGANFRRPCAEAITADDPGTFVVNYRNEPVGLRIQDTATGGQASEQAGDLAYALKTFRLEDKVSRAYKVSRATFGRVDSSGKHGVLDAQPREGDRIGGIENVIGREPTCFPRPLQVKFGGPAIPEKQQDIFQQSLCQKPWSASATFAAPLAEDGDPFTPLLRAYDADRVRVKIQAGGHEETHNASIHGVKWLQGGSGYGFDSSSGWRNSQQAGISEQFTFASPLTPFSNADKNKALVRLENLKKANQIKEGFFARILRFVAEVLRGILNYFAWVLGFPVEETGNSNAITTQDVILRKLRDYLYTIDASTEGYWNGSWGLMRSYSEKGRKDLQILPNADKTATIFRPVGVCPVNGMGVTENLRKFDISAVLANDVLDNKVDAKIASGASVLYGKLNHQGNGVLNGTLVYNPRKVAIRDARIPADPGDGLLERSYEGHPDGVLHDPTAIMYVYTSDLTTKPGAPDACMKNGKVEPDTKLCPGTYLRLKDDKEYRAPVEPLVMRAAAGDCIEVTLRNLIGEKGAPDILTYRKLAPVIPRFPDQPDGTVLNSNRVRTSSIIGLHPALVAYDIAADDGTAVGVNDDSLTLALPNSEKGAVSYRWYAGDISLKPFDKTTGTYLPVYTPVEFGAANLMPADKIKQGQKALVGALVIEPEGAKWTGMSCKPGAGENCLDTVADHQGSGGDRATRLSTTVVKPDGHRFRDLVTVFQDGLTQVYGDGKPVEGITAEDIVAEDAQDSGAMAINYGSEPLWFRYGLLPLLPFTGPKTPAGATPISFRDVPNAHEAYSESLAYKTKEDILREQFGRETIKDQSDPAIRSVRVSGEPAVPVLTAMAGEEMRMHILHPVGNARGSVFNLHGHVWQRAPYYCPGDEYIGMKNVCPETGFFPTINRFKVGSRAIGENSLSMYMGGQDSIMPAAHFDILLKNAGGKFRVPGDYLYRDQASLGNLAGLWGVVRVQPPSDTHLESRRGDN